MNSIFSLEKCVFEFLDTVERLNSAQNLYHLIKFSLNFNMGGVKYI